MPTRHPRVQVTIDPELEEALEAFGARAGGRSRLIRDLALRGAAAERVERERALVAREFLLRVVRGETDYDPAVAAEVHAERERQAD
jgi:hypothetical protein